MKSVFLAGSGSGIGLECAVALLKEGFTVTALTRNTQKTRVLIQDRVGIEALKDLTLLEADFTRPETLTNCLKDYHYNDDIVILNSGGGELVPFEEMSEQHCRDMFELNFFAHLKITRPFVKNMRERGQGTLIFMGSVVFDIQFPFKSMYNASKSALSAFALSLRSELKPLGIKVHILEPGWVRSNFHNAIAPPPANPAYSGRFRHFLDLSRDQDTTYPDGAQVANIIIKIIRHNNMPVRIKVGKDSRALYWGKRIFGEKFLQFLADRLSRP